jgi:hypothetical protein
MSEIRGGAGARHFSRLVRSWAGGAAAFSADAESGMSAIGKPVRSAGDRGVQSLRSRSSRLPDTMSAMALVLMLATFTDRRQWTNDGRLRQPRFLGLRDDKQPGEVVRERPR